jgi:hypothetical protein
MSYGDVYFNEDLIYNIIGCVIQGKFSLERFDGCISIVVGNDSLNGVTQDLINNIKPLVSSNTVSREY